MSGQSPTVEALQNGLDEPDIVDTDIQQTVGRLCQSRQNQRTHGRHQYDSLEEMLGKALQAERNHWKEKLQVSMHEIDKHHRMIIATQAGLQEIVNNLRYSLQKNVIHEETEEEEDADQGLTMTRLIAALKFQIRQLKVRAGIVDLSKAEFDESQSKQKNNISALHETITQLRLEKKQTEVDLQAHSEKIQWLNGELDSLRKQLTKQQSIISRYNETHSGSNFHLKVVETPKLEKTSRTDMNSSLNLLRERTYIEGDRLHSYPTPADEDAVWKDRIQKSIYSSRRAAIKSSVAQCLRCQKLFKPSENNHKSCRYHHKGREIKEQFDESGRLANVEYKWACCKKTLDAPGCTYGYHV